MICNTMMCNYIFELTLADCCLCSVCLWLSLSCIYTLPQWSHFMYIHRRRNQGGTRGTCPPLVSICPLVPPPFKLSNLVFNLQWRWKARVCAPVKWSAHAIYLCLPPPNTCKKKPLIHFSFAGTFAAWLQSTARPTSDTDALDMWLPVTDCRVTWHR